MVKVNLVIESESAAFEEDPAGAINLALSMAKLNVKTANLNPEGDSLGWQLWDVNGNHCGEIQITVSKEKD